MIEIIPNWHPLLVHFTVALLSVAGVLLLLAHYATEWHRRDVAIQVGEWNLWIGSLITVITVLAGWYAYNTVAHDAPSHAAMTEHRNWALATLVLMLLLNGWWWRLRKSGTGGSHAFSLALLVFIILLGITAWHGGELVYRYGLGVMSLPVSEGDGHEHDHGSLDHEAPDHEAPGHSDEHTHLMNEAPAEVGGEFSSSKPEYDEGHSISMNPPPAEMAVEPTTSPDVHVHDDGHQHTH